MTHRPISDQLVARLRQGVQTAGDLQSSLGVSSATVRRALDELGPDRLLRMGKGRATRYGLRRIPMHCGGTAWPLHEVSPEGELQRLATLYALEAGEWYLEPAEGHGSHPMHAGSDRGVFQGLPWFLETARPQGFLGSLFAKKAHQLAHFPKELELWTDDHVLAAAMLLGDDLPGNLLVGSAATRFGAPPSSLPVWSEDLLVSSMQAVLNGEAVGSSAGGEQPKFTLLAQSAEGGPVRRIVKFSPEMVTPGAQRWGDLLVAEHLANDVLREAGIPTARTFLRLRDQRWYLESDRFDRVGLMGRRGLSALGPLAYTLGYGGNRWSEAAQMMVEAQVLNPIQMAKVQFLQAFGRGIGNTDMHLGNLSLWGSVSSGWEIAPVYDMTPMAYIPGRTMEVAPGVRSLPVDELPAAVAPWVRRYWERLANDPRLSTDFRAIARHHEQSLSQVVQPPRPFEANSSPVTPVRRPRF